MSHTLTISGLTDFEADHINEILTDYKRRMIFKKFEAIAEDCRDGGGREEWFNKHIAWHETVMAKIKWTKE